MTWPEWVGVAGVLFAAVVGGSWLGDLITARMQRSLDVQVAHTDDVHRAAAALVEYGSLVAERKALGNPSLDHELRRAGNALESAVAMVQSHELGGAVREYVELSELFASGDPGTSEHTEREMFRSILRSLRAARLTEVKKR